MRCMAVKILAWSSSLEELAHERVSSRPPCVKERHIVPQPLLRPTESPEQFEVIARESSFDAENREHTLDP